MILPLAFTYKSEYFNVRDTLECGQIFRYQRLDENRYAVRSLDKYAELVTEKGVVKAYSEDKEYFRRFFDLETDYSVKAERVSAISPVMRQAVAYGKGIRILNQDLTEMIFSFIISANNNIKRIQKIIERICSELGEDAYCGKAFPALERLAACPAERFADMGAGYRDKYIAATAQKLLNYDLNALLQMDSVSARKELLTFLGVGPKVADCILLFGMHRGDVFPVDTWLKKVYHAYFEQGHRDSEISSFFCNLFGEDAGLCQQYLFYFQRNYGQKPANTVQ